MIPRYSRPEMAAIWTDARRLALWLEVELQVAEAMAGLGRIPAEVAPRLRRACEEQAARLIDPERIADIERATRHDVIAFLAHVEAVIGPDARYLHLGLTSSDLLDTTFALQLREASDLLLAGIDRVLAALRRRAEEHRRTVCIGRSHGIHAEPTTFGVKLAGFYAEFARNRRRLEQARAEIATCAISGAVGTFANVEPQVEMVVAKALGLTPEQADQAAAGLTERFATLQPIPRAGSVDDIASMAVFLASDESSFVTGQDIIVDGGQISGRLWSPQQEGLRHTRQAFGLPAEG